MSVRGSENYPEYRQDEHLGAERKLDLSVAGAHGTATQSHKAERNVVALSSTLR